LFVNPGGPVGENGSDSTAHNSFCSSIVINLCLLLLFTFCFLCGFSFEIVALTVVVLLCILMLIVIWFPCLCNMPLHSLLTFALATSLLHISTIQASLQWSLCTGYINFDCAALEVPLEYANPTNGAIAQIPLVRFNATLPEAQRKGSLLTNPGGPGASGVSFVLNGAGQGISNITGGFYDIIGWDPRGIGKAQPVLQCFATAGEEYNASSGLPAAAEVAFGQFRNVSYFSQYTTAIEQFDSIVAELAHSCATLNSSALYTSSAAYVVRDMAAIVDALDGTGSPLNYWGFSYGTIFGAEFIQTYPDRVGKIIFDGVFDAAANKDTYVAQLPNDQLSVREVIDDLVSFCEQAGADGCALATPPSNVTADLATRLANLQESLYENPVAISEDFSITVGIFSSFMWSFSRVPTAWSLVASVVSALENGDPTPLVNVLSSTTPSTPADPNAPATGSLAEWPLQCVDNEPSSGITLNEVATEVLNTSLLENTPWLNADITPLSFCRSFPDTRPQLSNIGASKLAEINTILSQRNTPVLIANGEHDPVTPLTSAQRLHSQLSSSSQLITRHGPGHTTISLCSLGLKPLARTLSMARFLPAKSMTSVNLSSHRKSNQGQPRRFRYLMVPTAQQS
jgi:pimeloyl-ACP methyl ester carboxylesterase